MPIPLIAYTLFEGPGSIPYLVPILRAIPWLFVVVGLKLWFGGARNTAERDMHSKVVMITGATSGIGAAVAHEIASRGGQLVLLTQHSLTDAFLVDFIMDLRRSTQNQLITAEQVDLASLHSIRRFATKWIDNAPPRRLDMIILCASTALPKGAAVEVSEDGVELTHAVNYLANFQLLSILSPALRAQPPHRDVRIIVPTCSSYIGAPYEALESPTIPRPSKDAKQGRNKKQAVVRHPRATYAASKICLMAFAAAYQKHLDAYKRPDGAPMNSRIIMVDPGWSRTPGMRRWITAGSFFWLATYLATYPAWWLILKSPLQGAQVILSAAMDAEYERGKGGRLLKECRDIDFARKEILDESKQRKLWEVTEKAIEALEKEGAVRRADARKQEEKDKKREGWQEANEAKQGAKQAKQRKKET